MKLRLCLLVSTCLAIAAPALAQGDPTDPRDAQFQPRIQFGPVALRPTFVLSNFGVDSNVFNQADVLHPSKDFTTTVSPQNAWALRLGRARLSGDTKEDLVYYQQFSSERSANLTNNVSVRLPLNRLTFEFSNRYLNTRDRPNFEIDARSRHSQLDYDASATIRALSKTSFVVVGRESQIAFDHDLYLGSDLRTALNRHMTTANVAIRHQLTPVTDVTLNLERESDRFDFSPMRSSNSTGILGGMTFKALLNGSAVVGYRRFDPVDTTVRPFHGVTASVDFSCRLLASTRLAAQVQRDAQYSFDSATQPYYVFTGATVSVIQDIGGPFQLAGRAGLRHLGYRGRFDQVEPDRTDSIQSIGATIGYRIGGTVVGFNVDQQRRVSNVPLLQYGGFRYGTSMTYGF